MLIYTDLNHSIKLMFKMVSSDRSCLPSVKSTISIANDLEFIIYVRLIETVNHKYNLFFSFLLWVMIFFGKFLNQQFLKVKPIQEGEKGWLLSLPDSLQRWLVDHSTISVCAFSFHLIHCHD